MESCGNPLFDVTMGSYDGAEVCELVGLYLLSKLTPQMGIKNVGLYRDDSFIHYSAIQIMGTFYYH